MEIKYVSCAFNPGRISLYIAEPLKRVNEGNFPGLATTEVPEPTGLLVT